MTTYWKNLASGCIYKYYEGTKPFHYETEWKEVTANDYYEALSHAYALYADRIS